VRIAPPFLPPHHSDPVAKDFQSSIPVEALLRGCHLDVRFNRRSASTGMCALTGGVLQPGWRTGSPWLLDRCDEEAGREEQSSPTFDLR